MAVDAVLLDKRPLLRVARTALGAEPYENAADGKSENHDA